MNEIWHIDSTLSRLQNSLTNFSVSHLEAEIIIEFFKNTQKKLQDSNLGVVIQKNIKSN